MPFTGADLKERAKMHPSEVGPFVASLRAGMLYCSSSCARLWGFCTKYKKSKIDAYCCYALLEHALLFFA